MPKMKKIWSCRMAEDGAIVVAWHRALDDQTVYVSEEGRSFLGGVTKLAKPLPLCVGLGTCKVYYAASRSGVLRYAALGFSASSDAALNESRRLMYAAGEAQHEAEIQEAKDMLEGRCIG